MYLSDGDESLGSAETVASLWDRVFAKWLDSRSRDDGLQRTKNETQPLFSFIATVKEGWLCSL